jgi:ribosomal protein S5
MSAKLFMVVAPRGAGLLGGFWAVAMLASTTITDANTKRLGRIKSSNLQFNQEAFLVHLYLSILRYNT